MKEGEIEYLTRFIILSRRKIPCAMQLIRQGVAILSMGPAVPAVGGLVLDIL